MNIPGVPKKWESVDAATLRSILESDVMQRALAIVADKAPDLLDGSDVNKTLVASGKVQGFNLFLHELFLLVVEQPEQPTAPTNYPDIDDDSKWQDGSGEQTNQH